MANRLSKDQWGQIRRSWEYDPDRPQLPEAGRRAGEKFGFTPPSRQVIDRRHKAEAWERKGTSDMGAVNAAAQRKADVLGVEGVEGAPQGVSQGVAAPSKKGGVADAAAAASSNDEAEGLRAAVLKRHRQEWVQVAGLRQEAIVLRPQKDAAGNIKPGVGSVPAAFEAMKLAKITAEATAIQQSGERKAWGLDIVVDPDQMDNLSDEQLRAIANGKAPPGMR